MIKFEKPEVWGWEHAIRGMRNPLNSWERSDSYPAVDCGKCGIIDREGICHPKEHDCTPYECYAIGDNDKDLMTRLIRGGAPHRKFLRQIFVSVDITAPLYWWKEFDTYKVGTTANSCSTMHKIQAKEFTFEDFSCEHLDEPSKAILGVVINELNNNRGWYNDYNRLVSEGDFTDVERKQFWWNMIQLLPSSFNQKRTVTMTYENLLNMLEYRRGHKLDEWRMFCDWILTLPHGSLLKEGVGMNRAERRRQKKAGIKVQKEPTLNLKVSDFDHMVSHAEKSAKERATAAAIHEIDRQILEHDEAYSLDIDAMVLWTLHVYLGFGKKRLERFYRDMLKEHIHMREVYEMDDTYPERYKLKELCNVDVEALNNEFKEVIHNV